MLSVFATWVSCLKECFVPTHSSSHQEEAWGLGQELGSFLYSKKKKKKVSDFLPTPEYA